MPTSPPRELDTPPTAPRGVAVSGLVFSVLFAVSIGLIRFAVPADPKAPGEWIADENLRGMVRLGLNLIPFAGIAFLWFMAALRSHIGSLEDRFLATVFLGSGLLLVALLFASGAVSSVTLEGIVRGEISPHGNLYFQARSLSYTLINVFGIKMAAAHIFVSSAIGLRTGLLPRWLVYFGYVVGLVLILALTSFAWIVLLFPLWVSLVSIYLLVTEHQPSTQRQQSVEETQNMS